MFVLAWPNSATNMDLNTSAVILFPHGDRAADLIRQLPYLMGHRLAANDIALFTQAARCSPILFPPPCFLLPSSDFQPSSNTIIIPFKHFPMDSFKKIPPEVLFVIAKQVPDLACLHSLRVVSPAWAALLSDQRLGCEIVEAVATASLDDSNRSTFGLIWQLLQRPESVQYTAPDWTWKGQTTVPHVDAALLPAPESTLRLLALADVVHHTAHRSLHTFLPRFTALRPQRPKDPSFDLRQQLMRMKMQQNYTYKPPSEPIDINLDVTAAPPSWHEEQRALADAWRLALYSVVREQKEMNAWSSDEEQRQFLGSLMPKKQHRPRALPRVDAAPPSSPSPPQRLSKAFLSAPACDETCRLVRERPHLPQFHVCNLAWDRHFTLLQKRRWSLLGGASIESYRELGFDIWDESRLAALGLFHSKDMDIVQSTYKGQLELAEHSDIYAWRSLLTQSQIEALMSTQYAKLEQQNPFFGE